MSEDFKHLSPLFTSTCKTLKDILVQSLRNENNELKRKLSYYESKLLYSKVIVVAHDNLSEHHDETKGIFVGYNEWPGRGNVLYQINETQYGMKQRTKSGTTGGNDTTEKNAFFMYFVAFFNSLDYGQSHFGGLMSNMELPRLSTLKIDVEGETKNTLRNNWVKMNSPRAKFDKDKNFGRRPWMGRRWRPRRCEMEMLKNFKSPSHEKSVFVFKKTPVKDKSNVIPILNLSRSSPGAENFPSIHRKTFVRKAIDENWERSISRSPKIGLPSLQTNSMSLLVRRVSALKASDKQQQMLRKKGNKVVKRCWTESKEWNQIERRNYAHEISKFEKGPLRKLQLSNQNELEKNGVFVKPEI
eukprot:jgi/Bigna1/69850/fgenesh1_pg.10_\